MWDGEPNNAGRFAIPFWRIHYDQDMRCSGIYRIDLGNGNFYIGSAVDLARRERQHLNDLKSLRHRNDRVQKCWNKHGVFEFTILEQCKIQELLLREQVWIDKYFSDPKNVNLSPTAGSPLGVIHSVETCAKFSARVYSVEYRANMSKLKKNMSAETKKKISAGLTGKKLSSKTRARMSSSHTGKKESIETRTKKSIAGTAAWARRRTDKYFVLLNKTMEEMGYGKECW